MKTKFIILGVVKDEDASRKYTVVLKKEKSSETLELFINSEIAEIISSLLDYSIKKRVQTIYSLFSKSSKFFSIKVKEVNIYIQKKRAYAALIFWNKNKIKTINSKTSDALVLALEFDCPIYVIDKNIDRRQVGLKTKYNFKEKIRFKSISDLLKMQKDAIKIEDYEVADRIKKELEKRNNNNK